MRELIVGIYQIKNTINGKIYIGSSSDIHERWLQHKYYLNKNTHPNMHLQLAWNKYGGFNFEFSILEKCQRNFLIENEQRWLDSTQCFDREIGYNICPSASVQFHSAETKRKVSESRKGIKLSEQQKQFLSDLYRGEKSLTAKITMEDAKRIRELYKIGDCFQRDLAREFKLSKGTIQQIIENRIWCDEKYVYDKKGKSGKNNSFYGKKHSDATKQRIRETKINCSAGKGEKNPKAKLTWEKVREIRELYLAWEKVREIRELFLNKNFLQKQLSKKYGVTKGAISKIILNNTWHDEDYELSLDLLG